MSFELDAPDFACANKHRLDGVVVTAMGRNAGGVLCVGWQGKSDEDGECAGHVFFAATSFASASSGDLNRGNNTA